jgi:CspA family cold shock protein
MNLEQESTASESSSSDNTKEDTFRLSGTVKWFDPSKGWGFLVPNNGLPDVQLHFSVLRAAGHQVVYEGATMLLDVLKTPKGPKAFRIISVDDSTAIHPSQLPARTHVVVKAESDWERVMVKWFNRVRGFGFLTRGDGSADVFVHMETLRRFGFTELRPGQIVQVRWGKGSKGVMAAELRPDALQTSI